MQLLVAVAKHLYIDGNDISRRVVSKVFTCIHVIALESILCVIVKYGFNKVVVWLWSWGCTQICGGGCGIV